MTPVILSVGMATVGRRGQAASASCGLAFIVFPALLRGLREPRLASITSVAKSIPFTPLYKVLCAGVALVQWGLRGNYGGGGRGPSRGGGRGNGYCSSCSWRRGG